MREQEHERRGTETDERREVRLQHMREQEHERRGTETDEWREVRLQRMREHEHERRNAEDTEQGESRLQLLQESRRRQSVHHPQIALIDQPSVRSKMLSFHLSVSSIQVPTCMTCLEGFPGLTMCSGLNECSRCHRDSSAPKLYSCDNNMDPGNVPPQLQVITFVYTCSAIGHMVRY